jgi:hypothetical protein
LAIQLDPKNAKAFNNRWVGYADPSQVANGAVIVTFGRVPGGAERLVSATSFRDPSYLNNCGSVESIDQGRAPINTGLEAVRAGFAGFPFPTVQ